MSQYLSYLNIIIGWLTSFWKALPEESRAKIINSAVAGLEDFFRGIFRREKGGGTERGQSPSDEPKVSVAPEKFEADVVPVVMANVPAFGLKESQRVAESIYALLSSDEFVAELMKNIGDIKENETEDDYVSRAKMALTKLLNSKLKI